MADAPATTDAPADTEDASTETPATAETPTPDKDESAQWKALARKHEKAEKAARAELDKLRQASMSEQEKAVALARAEGRAEAAKSANERLLRAEVRSLAAPLLADPDDAVHLLDLSGYEPDENGEYDRRAIQADLAALVKTKPYLGTQPGTGSGEGGPRGRSDPPSLNGDPLLRDLKNSLGV